MTIAINNKVHVGLPILHQIKLESNHKYSRQVIHLEPFTKIRTHTANSWFLLRYPLLRCQRASMEEAYIYDKCKTYSCQKARGGHFGDRHRTVDPPRPAPLGYQSFGGISPSLSLISGLWETKLLTHASHLLILHWSLDLSWRDLDVLAPLTVDQMSPTKLVETG